MAGTSVKKQVIKSKNPMRLTVEWAEPLTLKKFSTSRTCLAHTPFLEEGTPSPCCKKQNTPNLRKLSGNHVYI